MSNASNPEMGGSSFQATPWSKLEKLRHEDPKGPRPVLGHLVQRYQPPLLRYLLRRWELSAVDAEECLQEFIRSKVLERKLLLKARRPAGRLRSYLLRCLCHFTCDWYHEHKKHRAVGGEPGDTTPGRAAREPSVEDLDPFDRDWALHVIQRTTQAFKERCEATGHQDYWCLFEERVLKHAYEGADPTPFRELAELLGYPTQNAASAAAERARNFWRQCLHDIMREFVDDPADIPAEITNLRNILSRTVDLPLEDGSTS